MSETPPNATTTINEHEAEQVERANATGRQPVVFVHGLWLLPHSWDRWATVFEEAGYTALTPGWPDDPETVGEAKAHPGVLPPHEGGAVGRPLRRGDRPAEAEAGRGRAFLRRAAHPDRRRPRP